MKKTNSFRQDIRIFKQICQQHDINQRIKPLVENCIPPHISANIVGFNYQQGILSLILNNQLAKGQLMHLCPQIQRQLYQNPLFKELKKINLIVSKKITTAYLLNQEEQKQKDGDSASVVENIKQLINVLEARKQ